METWLRFVMTPGNMPLVVPISVNSVSFPVKSIGLRLSSIMRTDTISKTVEYENNMPMENPSRRVKENLESVSISL